MTTTAVEVQSEHQHHWFAPPYEKGNLVPPPVRCACGALWNDVEHPKIPAPWAGKKKRSKKSDPPGPGVPVCHCGARATKTKMVRTRKVRMRKPEGGIRTAYLPYAISVCDEHAD